MSVERSMGNTYEDRIRAAERERCAKIADRVWHENAKSEIAWAARTIANEIRNLKSE